MTYGCEVWGHENYDALEVLQRSFLKHALRINKYVSKSIIYGETGLMKLEIEINTRMIGFWNRTRQGPKSKISNILFNYTKKLADDSVHETKWVSKIKMILNHAGLNYLWNSIGINSTKLKSIIKEKLSLLLYVLIIIRG